MGIELTGDGSGIYYKQLWPLSNYTKLIGDAGIHFENSQPSIDMFGYNYNYQSMMLDFIGGYRYDFFSHQLLGLLRPFLIVGTGGMSDLKSFSNDNIAGMWMIKYILGLGVHFYNRGILNEFSLKYTKTKAIKDHVAFQLAFYWK